MHFLLCSTRLYEATDMLVSPFVFHTASDLDVGAAQYYRTLDAIICCGCNDGNTQACSDTMIWRIVCDVNYIRGGEFVIEGTHVSVWSDTFTMKRIINSLL